ncbi:aspartate--tRNA ligase [Amphiplicatus metriothermophilus]|uniref:Aspartate--tRNA(Asp/Asn) ligase n=1 Tax=Amphiplicatus metriothermophilus TaxID=1519374 RepID=A0A239PVU7_9PROT|nr:aspartate--tRNA ligase [Amphiplicatus metriothermophilus]MBB5519589.1 aspartyl-tRNA synthetase [Amphiplicatus metriothermophilus]SNT74153.1 aspartyl-tRNA synthetase [Amphiplicatus metriothermophilus]
MHAYRTHTCGALRKNHVGETVRLSGWVHRKRDHGGLLFIDLRDHYGLTQLVVEPEAPFFGAVERVRQESVIRIEGRVVARTPDTVNPNLATGEIEVRLDSFEVLSAADELPLPVFGEPDYPEEIRFRHRYLDLRRETLHRNIMLRSAIIRAIRQGMEAKGFTDFQTPILTASSPEGARDFLVPSRLHPGRFYALPQAPQIFKQLIMVAGFDRYYQIAPCFRDEDARADRAAGEFYQLDLEMSFVERQDVFDAVGPVARDVFAQFSGGRPVTDYPFPMIAYDEAMLKYGTDKPDLRNPLEMQVVSDHFRGSGFKVFASILEASPKNEVRAIPAPKGGSRAFCDRMNAWAQREGLPGMGYMIFEEGEAKGPLAKNIGPERSEAVRAQLGLKAGDAAFFLAGNPKDFVAIAGKARNVVAEELGLLDRDRFEFCWIVDFPMYEWNEEKKVIEFGHNPFSMPQGGLEALEAAKTDEEILAVKAFQYDLVCNGYELGSGAIRNHRPDVMIKAFEIAGYGREVVEEKFGGMLNAFRYGAPPHGGCALGIDRIVMLLADRQNIREVTMFPMNQQAQDLLLGAPGEASPEQLKELHIRVVPPIAEKKD